MDWLMSLAGRCRWAFEANPGHVTSLWIRPSRGEADEAGIVVIVVPLRNNNGSTK